MMATRRSVPSLCCLMVLATSTLWASSARAYPTWSEDPVNNTGYCATCHGDFLGFDENYTSLTADDPVAWGTSLMSGHTARYSLSCNDCHDVQFQAPVPLNASISGVTCATCHGREEDITPNDGALGGPGPGRGDGLRAHHAKAGFTFCDACHMADTTPAGEDIAPQTFVDKGIDPCDENAFGILTYGNVGLDNDGDGLRDGADTDCGGTATTTSTTTTTMSPFAATTTTLFGPGTVPGKSLLIKNKLPDNEQKNKIRWIAKDVRVIAGEIGSSADPRCTALGGGGSGGTLTVSSQTSGQSHTTPLPCEKWDRIGKDPGTGNVPKGYKYTDRKLEASTCKTVVIKHQKIVKAVCQGKGPTNLEYDLQAGQSQVPVDVVLTTGTREHCAQFGGTVLKDGTSGKIFKAKNAPRPMSCP